MGKKKTNLKPAPSLPPFPGLIWLQTLLTPSKQCRGLWGTGVCSQYVVFSLWCIFHLTLFLCSSVQSSWAMVSSGTSTSSGTGTPQAAVDTCSTMEHLLVLPPPAFCPLCFHRDGTRLPGSAVSWGKFTGTNHVFQRQPLASSQRPLLQLPHSKTLTTYTLYSLLVLLASRPPFSMKAFTAI